MSDEIAARVARDVGGDDLVEILSERGVSPDLAAPLLGSSVGAHHGAHLPGSWSGTRPPASYGRRRSPPRSLTRSPPPRSPRSRTASTGSSSLPSVRSAQAACSGA